MSALSWLSNIGSALTTNTAQGGSDPLMALLRAAGGIYANSQQNSAIKRGNVPTASETAQNAIYKAMLDPNSPQMKALTATNRAQNLSNFQQQLTEMQLADRRAQALGRSPTFFNPERADESVSYLTSRGLPQLNALAQQQALGQMGSAAEGYNRLLQPQAGRLGIQTQQGISNASVNGQIPAAILNALRGNYNGALTNPMSSNPAQPQPQVGQQYNYGQVLPQYNQQYNQMRY